LRKMKMNWRRRSQRMMMHKLVKKTYNQNPKKKHIIKILRKNI